MASKLDQEGCEYGRILSIKVGNIESKIDDFSRNFIERLDKFDTRQTELFNHQSSRLPMWTTIIITLLSSLVTGLAIWAITH